MKVNVGNQNYNIRNLKESVSPKINNYVGKGSLKTRKSE